MSERSPLDADFLNERGLNRQFVFDLAALPADIAGQLAPQSGDRQLILLGHGGRRLWECVKAAGLTGEHPIDDYSIRIVERWFAEQLPGHRYRILFPGHRPIGLQALGKLAGWHHPSPIMVGVDHEWGSWYAYRAALIADTDFAPSQVEKGRSPCPTCTAQPCVAACPADALNGGQFDLERCSRYRLQPESRCAHGCLARQACPVGSQHRYEDAQIMHSYSRSLAVIREYYR
jgi:hypothetical protein